MFDPQSLVAPYNSFAMTFREFVPHVTKVLESLGLTLQARTNFIKYVSGFITHIYVFIVFIELSSSSRFPHLAAIHYVRIPWSVSIATTSRPLPPIRTLRIGSCLRHGSRERLISP